MPRDRDAPATRGSVRDRRRHILLAGHTGEPDVAREALGDADGSLRIAALGALDRRRELTAPDLLRGLADPDPSVRRRAAELAGTHPEMAVTPPLAEALNDDDPLVAEMAAWALGERPHAPGVVEALSAIAANHEDPLCRESAVAALGALGDPAGLPAILQATTDRPAIRRRAVIALAPFEGPEVEAALVRARSDRDWQVRQAAEDQEGR
mgnify:CR=1 FL=1